MPGFTTHYLFGIEAYKRLREPKIRRNLKKYHSAFSLGLQGPDVFFYYLPSYIMHATNLGALAHDRNTGAFFAYLLESRSLFEKEWRKLHIADAYITGFLGHYTLDCTAHPYIYAFTNYNPGIKPKHTEYFGQHAYLETELDNQMLWRFKHMRPTNFHQNATIHLSSLEKSVVAMMLTYAYHNTYNVFVNSAVIRGALHWMQTGTKLVNDPSGQKKVMVRLVEKYALDRPFISPMLPSDRYQFVADPFNDAHRTWEHPWTGQKSTETFLDLFEKAGKLYDSRLQKYYEMVEYGFTEERERAFLLEYGNRSFLSGEKLF